MKLTTDNEGCWIDGACGYVESARRIQDQAKTLGWQGEICLNPNDADNFDGATDEADEFLTKLAPEGYTIGWYDGDYGMYKIEEVC